MSEKIERLESDLTFVRGVVDRSAPPGPALIYWFWALACAVGFALPDFAPDRVGTYWMVVGPGGWGLSMFLGYRHARRVGQLDAREGIRHLGHWGVMLLTVGLAVVLVKRGYLSPEGIGPMAILIVGLTYALAGLHLDRLLLLPGLLFFGGFGVLMFVDRFSWTIVGALVATGLAFAGYAAGRNVERG